MSSYKPGQVFISSTDPRRILRDNGMFADCLNDGTASHVRHLLNSFDTHCGDNAVECAEADLLGKALEVLKRLEWSSYQDKQTFSGGPDQVDACPVCHGISPLHGDICLLAAVLAMTQPTNAEPTD